MSGGRYSFGDRPLWQEHALLDFLCDTSVAYKKQQVGKGYFYPSTNVLLAALSYSPIQPEWKVTFDPEHPISTIVSLLQDLKTLSGACPARSANESELADFLVSIKSRVNGMINLNQLTQTTSSHSIFRHCTTFFLINVAKEWELDHSYYCLVVGLEKRKMCHLYMY